MSILVVGLSYRTSPVALLEQISVAPDETAGLLRRIVAGEHVTEALVLSTCNRVEVYADVERFHGGLAEISTVLAERAGLDVAALAGRVYSHFEDTAVQHLFQVTAGLDSMVVGEAQILGQLRAAYAAARQAGALGSSLHDLVQQALRVGKRAHSDTGIDEAGRSLVGVGLGLAMPVFGSLAGRAALVVGAGSMGALVAATLRRHGVGPITVASRTADAAQRLASAVDGATVPLAELDSTLSAVDIVVACTAATVPVLRKAAVEQAQKEREQAPLFLLDLGLPRDIEQDVGTVDGVTLVDLDVLRQATANDDTTQQISAAHTIIAEEVADYLTAQSRRRVVPTVTALRSRADEIVTTEVTRLAARLPQLDPTARDEVEMAVRRVVSTLLHLPTVRVKELAGTPDGEVYAEALRELFCLDPVAATGTRRSSAAVSAPVDPSILGDGERR